MKKLIFLLLLIPSILFGQMTRVQEIQKDIFGVKVNMVYYLAPNDTSSWPGSWLVQLGGVGELGPADGSQLAKVDAVGYTKHAKAGRVTPFNILTIQAVTYYTGLDKYLLEWMRVYFGAKKIAITGLSRGGQEIHNLTMADLKYADKLYVAAIPVAGRPDAYSTADPATVKDLPMVVVHGDKDTTVPYSQDTTWCGRVNRVPGRVNKIKVITLKNVGHDSWTWAYQPGGEVDQFIHTMLKPDPAPPKPVDLKALQNAINEAINQFK